MLRYRPKLIWNCARLALLCLACVVLPAVSFATELKIATWNLNWLTERPTGDPSLPDDVRARAPEDFDRLRQYAVQLNADVIAIQEVDGRAVAARIFPPDRYSIHMTRDDVVQRVGIVVRRGLSYDVNPDDTAIQGDRALHLRSGADITLHLGTVSLRVLAVHLKTGCDDASLTRSRRRACVELRAQVPPLQAWIAAREHEGVPFVVLGDFNRHMDGKDQLWAALSSTAPLVRATEGRSSLCWGSEAFIDHIIAGGAARDWMELPTLRVLSYSESGDDWKDRLSDHCPVSVMFRTPG
jgi:endonuclease/exonuclease/phosphatase family metal-dependent hydrolase